jgi:DNA-binding transcriptional regulator GbsR (MarR family)
VSDDFLVRDQRLPGHFWADNEVYDVFGPALRSHGFSVYMALCRNAVNGTGECRISMSKIADQLDIGKATVSEALKTICEIGLARVLEPGGPRTSALYLLADVKSLTDPQMAQLKLQRSISERSHVSVPQANASVRLANVSRTQRSISEHAIRKERLIQDLKTKNTGIEIPKGVLERNERDRRQRLTEATRKGLRNFDTHPLEDWESN